MPRFLGFLLQSAIAQVAMGALPATACTCLSRSEAEIVASADAVFIGRVVAIRGRPGGFRPLQVTLAVSTVTKGRIGREVVVTTAGNTAACGVAFVLGKTIRVAAQKSRNGLTTNLCLALTSQ